VVTLASQGLTNREIGERLYVSRRTVETHLSHAFVKLHVTSRIELAAVAARRSVRSVPRH
jgi:DNA-binding NarL/FixJ family response regulator